MVYSPFAVFLAVASQTQLTITLDGFPSLRLNFLDHHRTPSWLRSLSATSPYPATISPASRPFSSQLATKLCSPHHHYDPHHLGHQAQPAATQSSPPLAFFGGGHIGNCWARLPSSVMSMSYAQPILFVFVCPSACVHVHQVQPS